MSNSSIAHSDPISDIITTWSTNGFANIAKRVRFDVIPDNSPEIRANESDDLEVAEYGMDVPLIDDVTQIIVRHFAANTGIGGSVDIRINGSLVGVQSAGIGSGTTWYSNTFSVTATRAELLAGFSWVFTAGTILKSQTLAFAAVTMELTGRKIYPVV